MSTVRHSADVVRFAAFEVNLDTGELRRDGVQLRIQDQPLRLLAMLVARPGELVTRDELCAGLWSETHVEFDTALNSTVKRLRGVLNDSAENPRFIQTVGSRGYRFIYPVERINARVEEINQKAAAEPSPAPANPARTFASLRSKSGVIAIAASCILVAACGYLWLVRPRHVDPAIRAIAVLPLESLSSDPSQAYFADGLTDQLITDLGQISSVRITSRTSIMQYSGTHKPLPQIARELNVDAVVEGTILRSGNRVRITAQLIRAPADQHLWAQSYDGDLSDVLSLQKKVADDIANHIQAHLPASHQQETKNPSRPVKAEAYDAYLQGRYFEEQHNPGSLEKAIEYFKRAVEKDPGYALAYVRLASASHELIYRDVSSPGNVEDQAERAAEKALQLDDNSAEAHTVMAMLKWTSLQWEGSRTEQELRRAIQLNPSYASAHDIYAWVLSAEGRNDEAIDEAKRALELDPLGVLARSHLGDAYYFAHRYGDAIEQHRAALELYPDASEPNQDLAMDYFLNGMCPEFLAQADRWMKVAGESFSKTAAVQLNKLNRTDCHGGLRILIQQALSQRKSAYSSSVWIALLYSLNRQREEALIWLEKAYDERDPTLVYIAVEPAFDNVRSDPRVQALLRRANLPQISNL